MPTIMRRASIWIVQLFLCIMILGFLTVNSARNNALYKDEPIPVDVDQVIARTKKLVTSRDWFIRLPRYYIPPTSYEEAYYRVLPFAFEASITDDSVVAEKVSKVISIATQCSVDYAHEVVEMAKRWKSRISIGIFALENIAATHQLLARLRVCSPEVEKLVDFHIVYPEKDGVFSDYSANSPPKSYADIVGVKNIFEDHPCTDIIERGFGTAMSIKGVFGGKAIPYPLGFMRNVPRLYLRTLHQMSLDTDIMPSIDLAAEYERALAEYEHNNPDAKMSTVLFVPPGLLL
jgi:hypothetical protein